MSTADDMQAQWEAVKKNRAKKKYEGENPYMLITENAEGKADTVRFKTPNALEQYKKSKYPAERKLSEKERAGARISLQGWLSDDPQRGMGINWNGKQGIQATQDSVTFGLKKTPEEQLKAREDARKLNKLRVEEKYNNHGATALTDIEGRELFGEDWGEMKKKQAGPSPESKILEHNKNINEIDKNIMVKGKDEKGNDTEYLNSNFDDRAVAALENRKTVLRDSINIEVKNVRFNRFAKQWNVEPDYLKQKYNEAKAELARQQRSFGMYKNDTERERRANEILAPFGFKLKILQLMDDELAGKGSE